MSRHLEAYIPEDWTSIDTEVPVTVGFGGIIVGKARVIKKEDGALDVSMEIRPEQASLLEPMLSGYVISSLSFAAIPAELQHGPLRPDSKPVRVPCSQCGPGYYLGDEGCRHTH